MNKKSPFADTSAIQIAAAAAAAVLAAWLLSALGVAGTLLGAAVGSVAASIGSAFVRHGLETGRALVVTEVPADEVDPQTGERRSWFNVKRVLTIAVGALVVAVLLIVSYEKLTGYAFGDRANSSLVPGVSRVTTPTPSPSIRTPTTPQPTANAPTTTAPTSNTPTSTAPTSAAPTTTAPTAPTTAAPTADDPDTDAQSSGG